jgi:DNA-directed RNA polymerase specialized sigma subunit
MGIITLNEAALIYAIVDDTHSVSEVADYAIELFGLKRKKAKVFTKNEISMMHHLYYECNLSMTEISREIGCSQSAVSKNIKKYKQVIEIKREVIREEIIIGYEQVAWDIDNM